MFPGSTASKSSIGYLMPIGGAEDKVARRTILTRFVSLCGGPAARIAVLPAASSFPAEVGPMYERLFTELGAASVEVVQISERRQADDPALRERFAGATGVFMTGGDQVRLMTLIGSTLLSDLIEQVYRRGGIVAGTSAGASAISRHMIAFGRDGGSPSQRMVYLAAGLSLTDELIIDQHFRQRDRFGRLVTAVSYNPGQLGVGIDEDTALIIGPDGEAEVLGVGSVTVVDGRGMECTDVHAVKAHGPVAALGLKVHVLTSGYRLDLGTRMASAPIVLPALAELP